MYRSAAFILVIVMAFTAIPGCAREEVQPTLAGARQGDQAAVVQDPGPFFSAAHYWRYRHEKERRREGRRVAAKGIYVSGWVAGSPRMNALIDLVRETELNAVVIDVKDDHGNITYQSTLPKVAEMGNSVAYIKDLDALLQRLDREGIYAIARIVVFKDPALGKNRPDLVILGPSGLPWRDRIHATWADPYNREVWAYNVAVAKEAAARGFQEIQFDYVRFPSDGNLDGLVYPAATGEKRSRVIADFLAYARRELEPLGAFVSADVFGLVTSAADDLGIGQYWEELAPSVDYMSPMVYPSHYALRSYGLPDPDAAPYETVYRAMQDALRRTAGTGARIRPWLQDFTLRNRYDANMVRAQIKAVQDSGLDEWMLWNPYSNFTASALEKRRPVRDRPSNRR